MNNTLTLTPLFRRTVGFDRFNDLFEAALRNEDQSDGYPPYNIEKLGEDAYRITIALAGFSDKDLTITTQGNQLKVSGRIVDQQDDTIEYLHRGIATRAFEKTVDLADHVKVVGAKLQDGLLRINLVREIPEEAKPRMIPIDTASDEGMKVIEDTSASKKKK